MKAAVETQVAEPLAPTATQASAGAGRAFHGVDRTYAGRATLLVEGARINVTLRRALRPDVEGPALAGHGRGSRS